MPHFKRRERLNSLRCAGRWFLTGEGTHPKHSETQNGASSPQGMGGFALSGEQVRGKFID